MIGLIVDHSIPPVAIASFHEAPPVAIKVAADLSSRAELAIEPVTGRFVAVSILALEPENKSAVAVAKLPFFVFLSVFKFPLTLGDVVAITYGD